jgi:pyruvate formate lyase activating enzyme
MKEALFYKPDKDKKVKCLLCPHECLIPEKAKGFCGVRQNEGGKLYTLVYGRVIAASLDPIEKKPLYHFYPGAKAYSIATIGCNFSCLHCQNADISQIQNRIDVLEADKIEPEDIIEAAQRRKAEIIAYTYTEPTIFYELAYDTAELAQSKGLKNVFVTNGYINKKPMEKIIPFLDAANVDLKFFNDDLYRKICSGSLEPVLKTIELLKQHKKWVEVTTLIIAGYNDDKEQLRQIAKFISSIDQEMPWHVTAFFPANKLTDVDLTAKRTLLKAREIGLSCGLKNVYCGNVFSDDAENTYCPSCKKAVIERRGYEILNLKLENGKCGFCKEPIAGRFI